ncbi:hypothetical protein [Brucella intermedia]|uniref:hypothetical protein n=1 Tax=Brucella intermedia TaxID=94625 RepID=UPI00224A4EDA|nr:hypothetical protein [Brucella intermedia]
MAQQGRVQTPVFRNNLKLQPQARPVDTFEAPAAIPEDRNTARLIHALSSFSSSLGGLAPQLAASEKDRNKERNEAQLAERERFYMQSSPEAQRQYIIEKHGLDKSDRIQAAAIGRIDGAKAAELDQNDLLQEMQTNFDWENGDPEAYVREQLAKRLEASGRTDEPTYVSAYSRAGQSIAANIVAIRNKRLAEAQEQKVQGAAADYFRMTLDDSIKAGDEPHAAASKFLKAAVDTGSRGTLLLNDGDVEREQLDELERRIESNPEIVLAAIHQGRFGSGGALPAYIDNPQTRDRALLLDRKASIALQVQRNRRQQDDLISANTQAIEQGTGFLGLRDLVQTKPHSGDENVYTVEKQKDEAIRNWIKQDDIKAKRLGETPPQTILRRAQHLALSGLQDPDLKAAVDGIAQAGGPEVLSSPEARQNLIQRLDLINTVAKTNKNLSAAYLKGQDKEFVDGFVVAREVLGRDDTAALSFAYAVTNPSANAKARVYKERQAIINEVSALRESKWFSLGGPSMENSGMVEDHLVDLAEKYASAGLSGKEAVIAAKAAIQNSAIHYNGTLIDVGAMGTRADMPSDFQGAVNAQVEAFLEDSKGKAYNKSDITIYQTGDKDGRFYLVDKSTMSPLTDDQGNMHLFTLSNLRAWDNANREAETKANATYNQFNQSVMSKGLYQVKDKDGDLVWINKSREIWVNTADEGKPPVWKKTGKRADHQAVLQYESGLPVVHMPDKAKRNVKATSDFFSRQFTNFGQVFERKLDDKTAAEIAKPDGIRILEEREAATKKRQEGKRKEFLKAAEDEERLNNR